MRDRVRADEDKAKKPNEVEKTAEKAKQKTTTSRWPPGGVAAQKSVEEEKGTAGETVKKDATGKGGPSWRDRMAKKAEEEPAEKQERKG